MRMLDISLLLQAVVLAGLHPGHGVLPRLQRVQHQVGAGVRGQDDLQLDGCNMEEGSCMYFSSGGFSCIGTN